MVKWLEDLGAVVEGEAGDQDAALGAGEELTDDHGGIAGGAGSYVGAGPDQVYGHLSRTLPLGQHGIDDGQHSAALKTDKTASSAIAR